MKVCVTREPAEKALGHDEEKYRILLEATGYGFAVFGDDCKVIDANLEYVRLAGRSNPSEVVGHSMMEWTADGERSKSEAAVRECLKKGSIRGLEVNYLSLSGTIIPVEVSAIVVDSGNGPHILALCRDISQPRPSDRKLRETERGLADAEGFVRNILNSIGTGIVIVDALTHEIVEINDYALRLIGTDLDAARGRVCHQFICPAQKGACPISDLKNTVDNSERVLLTANGSMIPILKTVTPITRQGRPYLIESFWDITDRKRAEEALKLDESRLGALLQLHQMINATESQITHFAMEEAVRLTGSTIGYIAFADETESVLTMYAWSSTAMKECRIQDKPIVYPVKDTGLWGEAVRQRRPVVTNEYAEPSPLKKGIPEGHVRIARHMNVPIFDNDRIVIVAGVGNKSTAYDDTDIRQLTLLMSGLWSIVQYRRSQEQALTLQDKLERAERMESLGVLAGGVAHDLNNMLGPVVGFSELVLRDLPNDSKIASRVAKIMKSAQDAADVIQDLLTLARRGRYEMCPLLLNDVITSYLESPGFAKLKERHPNAQLDLALAPDLKPINGSHVHLSKVIMNLVANACEAMPDSGILSLQTETHHIKTLFSGYAKIEEGEYVVLKVKDSGIGISQEDLAKIFEPYYSKKKLGLSGSGLGLSVVYGVAKDHGGYYDVFSELGQGTEFVLYFPVCGDALPIKEDQINIAFGTEHVLIVDDSPDQRELAKEIVSTLGYRVDVVEDGHEALRFLKRQSVDIIMLDMIMETGFDGLDTYREILKIRSDQKVVIVSGFSATERVEAMQALGAGTYVRKPYNMNSIAKALRDELNQLPKNAIMHTTT